MPKLQFPKKKKPAKLPTYAFIDSQNLNLGIQRLGWKMDWIKFRQLLRDTYGVMNAYMFIGYMPEHEDLYMQLHEAGFQIVLKPTYDMTRPHPEMDPDNEMNQPASSSSKEKKPGSGDESDKHIKGNIDADLVLFAMKELPHYGQAIIVSGDGDFYTLVEYLEQQGKLKHILTPNQHYSGLYNAFDKYVVTLDKKRHQLAYRDRRSRRKKTSSQPSKQQKSQPKAGNNRRARGNKQSSNTQKQ